MKNDEEKEKNDEVEKKEKWEEDIHPGATAMARAGTAFSKLRKKIGIKLMVDGGVDGWLMLERMKSLSRRDTTSTTNTQIPHRSSCSVWVSSPPKWFSLTPCVVCA